MAETLLRIGDQWVPVGPETIPTPPTDTGPIPKPNEASTGPRETITGSTLNSSQAIAAAVANGGVLTGRRIDSLRLSEPAHADLIFRDCEITGFWFGVEAWNGFGTPPSDPARRATFEHCLIRDCPGNCGIAGRNVTVRYCEFTRNGDDMKPSSNTEVFGSLLHHLWAASSGAHGDNVQCFGGNDILYHWNTMVGRNAPDAPFQPNGQASSVLQPSDGGDLTNFRFFDNWVDGGTITLRGAGFWAGNNAHLVFRRNKHGRNYGSFPITNMGSFNGGKSISDYDNSNVWEDTGLPVLG